MLFSSVYNSKGQRVVALPPDVPSTPTAGPSNRKRGRQELDSNAEDPLSRERPVKRQGKQRQMVVALALIHIYFQLGLGRLRMRLWAKVRFYDRILFLMCYREPIIMSCRHPAPNDPKQVAQAHCSEDSVTGSPPTPFPTASLKLLYIFHHIHYFTNYLLHNLPHIFSLLLQHLPIPLYLSTMAYNETHALSINSDPTDH